MSLPLEGTWKLGSAGANAAGKILKKGDLVTIHGAGGNYTGVTGGTGEDKSHTWTFEYQCTDLKMIVGGVDSGAYSFVISAYFPAPGSTKKRIYGIICPRDYSGSGPSSDETEPGTWAAEEDPGGGDG